MDKFLIVGLGNPGAEYHETRHNAGWMVVDAFAKEQDVTFDDRRYGYVSETSIKGKKLFLLKPTTYMNLSGECVRELLDYYKVDETSELIVISDDVSLDVGQLRIRKKGSAGGHNGLKNIIAHLGHDSFIRIKMGVGEKPQNWDLADYVLGRFSAPEREVMDEAAERAADAVRTIILQDADVAMNLFNSTKRKEQ